MTETWCDRRDPLILTLAVGEAEQARFDQLRAAHFPPDRNLVSAHVTLFHHLPGQELISIQQALTAICRDQPPFAVAVAGLRSLGRGTAYRLAAPELSRLRATLAERWAAWLTAQDRQPYQPHLTIQNKVTPEAAASLLRRLQAEFAPFTIRAEGLLLWHYRGGPWEEAARFRFTPLPTTRS